MLLMVLNGIRRGICHWKYRYSKENDKFMKTMIITKNHYIFSI